VAEDNLAEARLFFGFCFGVTKCATAHIVLRSVFQSVLCNIKESQYRRL